MNWWQGILLQRHDPREAAIAILGVAAGGWRIYEYRPEGVVFFVKDLSGVGWVHMFSAGKGNLLRGGRLFMRDALAYFPRLAARVVLPSVELFARRFGWKATGEFDEGFPVYAVEREGYGPSRSRYC